MQMMPFFVPRLIGPDGKLLPGGRYDFFQAGTTTPKAVYDSNGTSLGSSVTVDGGASKLIYLGTGAYKMIAFDANGVQIGPPADNVSSSGLGPDSTGSICIVANYNALRGMVQDYDMAVVLGRSSQDDGGEGIFYRSPITNADDDGIVLLRNTTRYKRDLPGYIDPLWFGVQYGSTADQTSAINATRAASVAWKAPVWSVGQVYVASNFDMVSGSSLILDGSFASNEVGPSVRFLTGSRLIRCAAAAFTSNIQPVFAKGTVDAVRLSWMGGATTNDSIVKLNASATDDMSAIIDTVATYSGSVAIGANWTVDPSEGKIQFDNTVPGNIAITNVDTSRIAHQVVSWSSIATLGTVAFGRDPVRPEWFGAAADGATDDSLPFLAAAKTGRIYLTPGRNCVLGATWATTPSPLTITNGIVTLSTGKDLGSGVLGLESTLIVKTDGGNWFAGTYLGAVSSGFASNYTATTKSIVGCTITGDDKFPMFAGKPKIYNGHLDIPSAQMVGTDSVGKLIDSATVVPHSAMLVGTDSAGHIIDAGVSPNLNTLNFSNMFFAAWSVSAIRGTVTLSNPMKFIYMVDNSTYPAVGVDITLPTPGAGDPNVAIFFSMSRTLSNTFRGNFPTIGTSSIMTTTAILMYYDRASSGWYFIDSDA